MTPHSTLPLSLIARLHACCLAAALALPIGCGDDDAGADGGLEDGGSAFFEVLEAGAGAGGASDEDAGVEAPCAGETDGTACRDGQQHCIDQRCVWNTCGDGVMADREACDDGNEAIDDACDPACRVVPERCHDGIVQADEECDDGNLFELDACSNACTDNVCGNARLDGTEECDDGNTVDEDTCSNACTEVRCRNGRLDPGEACDDGNRIHDDGCNNACEIVVCGNGSVEGDEECDDGNGVEDDACANACTTNVCGNSRVDPGEACDGDTVAYACADDCSGMVDDVCRPCEDTHCSNYNEEVDLVAGCFLGNPLADLVPEVAPDFAQRCIDAVDCARREGCGLDPESLAIGCYCGSADVGECGDVGPAADAPCRVEWEAATDAPTNTDVLLRLANFAFPSGWAYYMLQCDVTFCASECLP